MSEVATKALEVFQNSAKVEFNQFLDTVTAESLSGAVKLIQDCEKAGGRIHITGIGKPGHVAAYMASLLSSTGTPTYFLHGTEAVHGSCGQLVEGDVIICISNSGQTVELQATVNAIHKNGCKVIGVTGNLKSWLAQNSEAVLFAGVGAEGGPLNRAPRNSILAEVYVLQALSVMLQADRAMTPEQYVRRHPGGALGHLRENEK
ncbi:SIS domain-containing protein [Oscillospiraceae bacterium LTW-04]|nr:SIS domain-containing protein [Oscillospiraceae bacterium MB24-C1]